MIIEQVQVKWSGGSLRCAWGVCFCSFLMPPWPGGGTSRGPVLVFAEVPVYVFLGVCVCFGWYRPIGRPVVELPSAMSIFL